MSYSKLFVKVMCLWFKSQTSDMMVRDLGRDSSRTKNHRLLTNTQLTGIIARTPYSTVTFYYFCKLLSHKWLPTKLSEAPALIKCSYSITTEGVWGTNWETCVPFLNIGKKQPVFIFWRCIKNQFLTFWYFCHHLHEYWSSHETGFEGNIWHLLRDSNWTADMVEGNTHSGRICTLACWILK